MKKPKLPKRLIAKIPRKLKKKFKKCYFGFLPTCEFHGVYRCEKAWIKNMCFPLGKHHSIKLPQFPKFKDKAHG